MELEVTGGGQFGNTTNTALMGQITSQTVLDFIQSVKDTSAKFSLKCDDNSSYDILDEFNDTKYYSGGYIPLDNPNPDQYGFGIEYVRFDVIIALINLYFNLKDESGKIISQILIPKKNLCLACPDSVVIDPTVCMIRNSKATNIFTPSINASTPDTIGFSPTTSVSTAANPQRLVNGAYIGGTPVYFDEYLASDNRGKIRNIYVSLQKVIEVYRSKMSGDSSVSAVDFLKDLLSQISRAMGGINNFQLHTTNSTIEIIDVKYLEQGAKKSKYVFDLMGLKSICRDVRITSRIFESQSTMIGIAAQSTSNVGDLYSSTQTTLNAGLTDRLIKKKIQGIDKSSAQNQADLTELKDQLFYYLWQRVAGRGFAANIGSPEQISNALSALKTYYYQFHQQSLGNTAIIPFELEITLDGISGLVIGQVFKIDTSILPQAYTDADVGFITTGVSHTLDKNDWLTVIKAQICILD
jgi:hypothetical protein